MRRREPREVWARRIERWRESGLGTREFAAEDGVKPERLRHWKRVLERACAEGRLKASPPLERRGDVGLAFVEVTRPLGPGGAGLGESIEIVTPSGLHLRVPPRFDEETLRRVLWVVR